MSVPVGCLVAGKTYVFSLAVDLGTAVGIQKQVSKGEV
jgi:hypothetical protein